MHDLRVGWRSLADGLAQPRDNFLVLRLLAASLVIYGHGPVLSGRSGPRDIFIRLGWGRYSGELAVDLFFVMSGFLVMGSYLRRRDVLAFVWARGLRIVPALAVCVVLSAFVLGPSCTQLPLAEYLLARGTRHYVLANVRVGAKIAFDLPGVFAHNPYPRTVNGALWTLLVEARLYACLAALGALGLLRRRWLCNVVLLTTLALALSCPHRIAFFAHPDTVRLTALFATGALCFVNRDYVPLHGAIITLASLSAWALRHTSLYPYAFGLAEVVFVFWFAYDTPWFAIDRIGDLSYGVYLWGFPMQQMLAYEAPTLAPLVNSALGFTLALVLAAASWRFVEAPTLALKRSSR